MHNRLIFRYHHMRVQFQSQVAKGLSLAFTPLYEPTHQ